MSQQLSFLNDYRLFTRELEVPSSFHTFCSLVALASLTGRRVWTYKGDYIRIYPNLYVVLVGPPGCGKNVAMEVTEDLLHHYKTPVSAESVTREKLILDIQAQESVLDWIPPEGPDAKYRMVSPYTILATELSEFLGAGGIGMISFLTDIYSRNLYESRTKNKGSTFIRGPFLNLIAGTTPDWVTNYLKDDIISGGFSRRCLFLYATGREGCNPRPRITPEMRAAWDRLISRGEAVRKLKGQFKWTPRAEKFFDGWYPSRKAGADPTTDGYYETKDIFLIKVAMLVAVSESDELVLDEHHFQSALLLLGLAELNLTRVFQGMGRNELNQVSVKAMDFLVNCPKFKYNPAIGGEPVETTGCTVKRFRAFMWANANGRDMDDIITQLRNSDKVILCTLGEGESMREYILVKPIG